mmetsp:Transcript_4909/g.11626  ORF Transcript_4909/g.11626 Transcript_4909/m.11626 type:complete len:465 (+) Transcript_4909:114-1508(+)
MVDLLPAGVISHGVYGGSQFVQNAPSGAKNSFGVMHPGSPLSFQYESAMVGAGYISCQGRRVCGATMTTDGFGRWSVPSAKDMADVLNMMTASNQSYHQYFDMSLEKVFEMICALQKEVRSLKGGGAAPAAGSWGGCGCGMGNMGHDFGSNDVVQGRVVDGTGGPRTTTRAQSADRTAATRRAPPGVAPDMTALENDVQELKRKFGMNMAADPHHGAAMCDGKTTMAKSAADTAKTTALGAGWDWRAKTSATPGPPPMEPPAAGTHLGSFDRPGTLPTGGSAAVPAMGATQTPAKPEMSQTTPRAAPWNRQVSPPAPSEPQHGMRPSPWSRPTPTTHTAPEPPLPGQRAETPMQQRQPPSSGAPTSPASPAKAGGTGGYKKANLEDAIEVSNLTAELDRCMMMRQVSAQSAGGASLSNVPCALNGRAVTPGRAPVAAQPQPGQMGASGRFKGVPQSVATKLFIK